jgi:hypothetical protein
MEVNTLTCAPTTTILTTSTVYCTVLFEGIHNWPGCPFDEVAYLRDFHRHVFYVKAHKLVQHNDRDVEFIMLKHQLEQYLKEKWPDGQMGATSCEMLAEELAIKFELSTVEVSEDNENGAIIHRTIIEGRR